VVSLCALSCGGNALAYRPFEGTDAAVADVGEQEIEFGPAEPLRDGRQRFLTAPETIFNLGVVLQGQAVTLRSLGPAQTSLVGDALFLKGLLRDGVLQDKSEPSVAVEFGPLLPGINGEPGTGVSRTGIASYVGHPAGDGLRSPTGHGTNPTAHFFDGETSARFHQPPPSAWNNAAVSA